MYSKIYDPFNLTSCFKYDRHQKILDSVAKVIKMPQIKDK